MTRVTIIRVETEKSTRYYKVDCDDRSVRISKTEYDWYYRTARRLECLQTLGNRHYVTAVECLRFPAG